MTLWTLFKVFELKKNERARGDDAYADWLLTVGDGSVNEPKTTEMRVKSEMVVTKVEKLIEHCFGKDIEKADSHDAAILCPTNSSARFMNDLVLQRFL